MKHPHTLYTVRVVLPNRGEIRLQRGGRVKARMAIYSSHRPLIGHETVTRSPRRHVLLRNELVHCRRVRSRAFRLQAAVSQSLSTSASHIVEEQVKVPEGCEPGQPHP